MHQSDRAEWARETLEIPPDAPPGEARSHVLRQLKAVDFVPDDSWQDALEVILENRWSAPGPAPLAYYHARESALREAVIQFAESYFDLRPAVRRERWARLNEPCQTFPPLRRWMKHLAAGLDVEPRFSDSLPESTILFGNLICREFLQLPGDAGHEIRHNLAMLYRDVKRWRGVARDFQRDFPDVARLSPGTIKGFAGYQFQQRKKELINRWAAFTRDLIPDSESPLTSKQMIAIISAVVTIVFFSASFTERKNSAQRPGPPFYVPPNNFPNLKPFTAELPMAEFERLIKANPEDLDRKDLIYRVLIDKGVFKVVARPDHGADNPEDPGNERPPPPPLPETIEAAATPPAHSPAPAP